MSLGTIFGYFLEIPIYITFPVILLIVFIVLSVLHRAYSKSLDRISVYVILVLGYLILIADILLKSRFYSVEWAFLGFVIVAVLFYDFKIDSRFLILPAILFLGYVPFLLMGKQDAIAETTAIYVYYFLVVGVVLQLIEHLKKIENSLDFDKLMKRIIKNVNWIPVLIIIGLVCIGILLANRFYNLELWKWTFVYVFVVILIIYFIPALIEDKEK
jgi:hypothetical protein